MACIGGLTPLEVRTQNVADGSEIKIDILDDKASKVDSYSGKVFSGVHRKLFKIPDTKSSVLLFTAKLSSHNLESTSSRIQVLPRIIFGNCQHVGPSGSTIQEITDEGGIKSTWDVTGAPNNAPVEFSLLCKMPGASEIPVWKGKSAVQSGKTEIVWVPSLPKEEKSVPHVHEKEPTAEKYEAPVFRLKADCLGASTTTEAIKYTSWVQIDFGNSEGEVDFLFPDGRTETKKIPEDGVVRLKGPAVGELKIVATRFKAEPQEPSDEDTKEPDSDPSGSVVPQATDDAVSPSSLPKNPAKEVAGDSTVPAAASIPFAMNAKEFGERARGGGTNAPPPTSPTDNVWKLPFANRPDLPKKEGETPAPGCLVLKAGKSSLSVSGKELGGGDSPSDPDGWLPRIEASRNSSQIQNIAKQFVATSTGFYYYANEFWKTTPEPDPIKNFPSAGPAGSIEAAKRIIWQELKKEGHSSSINAYDGSYRFTWGRGFLGPAGGLQSVLAEFVKSEFGKKPDGTTKTVRDVLNEHGIDFDGNRLIVVNLENHAVETDKYAYGLAQSDPNILAVFSWLAETAETRQAATDAQWQWINKFSAAANPTICGCDPDVIALAGHFMHWIPGKLGWSAYKRTGISGLLLDFAASHTPSTEVNGVQILKGSTKDIMVKLPVYANGIGFEEIKRVCPQPLVVPKGWFDTPPASTSSTESSNPNVGIYAFPVMNGKEIIGYYFYPSVPAIPGAVAVNDISGIAHLDDGNLPMKSILTELDKKKKSAIDDYCNQKASVGTKLQSALRAVQLSKASAKPADKKSFLAESQVLALPFADQQSLKGYLEKTTKPADNAASLAKEKKWKEFIDAVQGRAIAHLLETLICLKSDELQAVCSQYETMGNCYGGRFRIAGKAATLKKRYALPEEKKVLTYEAEFQELPAPQKDQICGWLGTTWLTAF